MTVLNLSEYKPISDKQDYDQIEWEGREFRTVGSYYDRAQRPLFDTSQSLRWMRKDIEPLLPRGFDTPHYSKVMAPFVESAATFWRGGVDTGAFNQTYAPFTIFYYVLREHPKAILSVCDGVVIEDENAYNRILNRFNKTFHRVLQGRGSGTIRGYCSEDEMIRMGTLFLLLQMSCDQSKGLVLDPDRRFANKWGGKKVVVDLDHKAIDQYCRKLQNVVMSDMHWKQFLFRYIDLTDSETLWFINTPEFSDGDGDESVHQWFDQSDFVDLIDLTKSIDNRGGKLFMVVRHTKDFLKDCVNMFDFFRYAGSSYKNDDGLYLHDGFEDIGDKVAFITNYPI